jgi:putative ABC transport system permease protein
VEDPHVLTRLLSYARGIARRRRIEAEADEELAFHLQQEIEANVASGLSAVEARRTALARLGGLAQTTEAVRDVRATWVDATWRDVRHALRSLRATPSFTIVALAVLTLSIGSSTAIFSVVDAVVLRGLPFPDADRLVAVGELNVKDASDQGLNLVAPQNFLDWRARQRVFTGLAAIGYASISVKPDDGQEPETLETQAVTADFFPVLGSAPLIGRTFTAENEVNGRAFVAVISYGLWQRRFGGAPDIVGQYLHGQLADFEILGVMPPSFAYPAGATRPTEVWLPHAFAPEDSVRGNEFSYRLQVIGRLREGTTVQQAQAQMDQITAGLAAETPRWFEDRVARVEPLRDYVTRGVRTWMLMLLAAVGFVLLIASVNLATLILVRVSARSRELVIRSALGASRRDLVRALVVESLILSLAGAALGVFAAWLGVEVLRSAIPPEVPRVASIAIDSRVMATTVLLAVASGLLFSIAPIIQFSRPSTKAALTQATRANTVNPTHQWLRGALVTLEVALAVVLLVGSGLFLASFARVSSVNLGIDPRSVLAVRVRPLVGPLGMTWEVAQQRNRGRLQKILERVRTNPGVDIAAWVGGGVPLRGDLRTIAFGIPGRVLNDDLDFNEISPDYFRAMRVPLLKGRFFADEDRQGSEPVAIINDAAAKKHFPGVDPIGRTVNFLGTRRIVGIVGNIRHDGPETDWRRQGFVPLNQSQAVGATLVLRLSRDAGDVLPAVKSAIWSEFPGLALPDTQTLSHYLNNLIAPRRFNMLLLTTFGLLGVVIACVGIYGVMAYVVMLRTPEIGIRMALGAVPSRILWSVLGRALTYLAGGLVIGLTGAWILSALVSGFLFEIRPHDPWVYAGVGATLVVTGLTAAFLPARRASRVDPLVALRLE